MKKTILVLTVCLLTVNCSAQTILANHSGKQRFSLEGMVICVDPNDFELVQQSAYLLQQDIEMVTGSRPAILNHLPQANYILIGSAEKSALVQSLSKTGKFNNSTLKNKWEAYHIQSFNNSLVIAGSDRRGTAYGVFELSRQLGVSPWYWWADVPVKKQQPLYIKKNSLLTDAPKVKYRGIFINDEAPALSDWTKEKFGGFNHKFYEKVFELILRLKGNYIWPAMWGNAFYDDDSLNIQLADKYGIVIGTSHHEPLMRAHDEWRRHGSGKWNYDSNAVNLQAFWRAGMRRATNEKIVSVGMRGDGDEPMTGETATALLERIVADQRTIIADVTGKSADQTPQLWALYKEVQDYYDKGMKVPDDVTLLLCDDNWGNIRRLPKRDEKPRQGGYGIYYHFDYVGGPRNYKWLNTNPLPRIWEQMNLAWQYNARQIWIVNVGDIKPMEFPVSFFLDYAWNPERIGKDDIQSYSENWTSAQFGGQYAKDIADILAKYAKFNSRRKPELLDANTYSISTGEWQTIVNEYNLLLKQAETISRSLPEAFSDAYFQLVLHPVKACANLNELYYYTAMNKWASANNWKEANEYADRVKQLYINDSLISEQYHQLNNGKWSHLMSQAHIGYTTWQQPVQQKIPGLKYVSIDSVVQKTKSPEADLMKAAVPAGVTRNVFYQQEKTGISIAADHYSKAINTNGITWQVLPDHGRKGNAITSFPVTALEQRPGNNPPCLEYEIYTYSKGEFTVSTYHSPSLNFQNTEDGLQYAISIDNDPPQIVSINREDKNSITGIWNKWVSENIIIKTTQHHIAKPGRHIVKYWMVNPGLVLQQLVLDFGDTEQSYLGAPETIHKVLKK